MVPFCYPCQRGGAIPSFYPADPVVTWTHDAILSTCAMVTMCSLAVEHHTGWELPAWTKQATPQALAKEKASRGARIAEMRRYSPQARHLMFLAMLALFRWLWPVVGFAVLWWIKFTMAHWVWG